MTQVILNKILKNKKKFVIVKITFKFTKYLRRWLTFAFV